MLKSSLAAVMALCAISTGVASSQPREYRTATVTISHPWSPPTSASAPTAAGYLVITNHGPVADRLLGVDSPAAASVSLHSMSMAGGIMRMRPVANGLSIAPGAVAILDPGGYHLMFEGLRRPFTPGDHIPAVLHFEHAGATPVVFDVEAKPNPRKPMNSDPHDPMEMH